MAGENNTGIMIPGEEPSGSNVERLARDMGWIPEEEYDGEPDAWVDAETFIRRGRDIQRSMEQHIKTQNKQLNELRAGLEDLRKHNERVYKTEVTKLKKEIEDLTAKRREAIEEGDPDRVEQIDKEIEDMKSVVSETEQMSKSSPQSSENPEFDQWKARNSWYGSDPELTAYAESQADNPYFKGLPYQRLLQKVEEAVKDNFPDKFDGDQDSRGKQPQNTVEGGHGRTGRRKAKYTRADLNPDQREIMDRFVRTGALTEEQYIQDLADMGEI